MTSLLLCGAAMAQEPAYVRAHDNNMPVVAQVIVDETPVTATDGWTLKAYIGDQRGEATIQTGLNNTYWIQVYYSTGTEDNTAVTFTITDGTDEYTSETTLNTDPEGYGTPSEPVEIEFATVQMMTQTNNLVTGWNWWSTPIEMNNIDGLTMLEESLGSIGIRIQSQNNFTDYYDFGDGFALWDGQLNEITNEQMYKIRTSVGNTISLVGIVANPSNHPITISKGWNWIGFPCGSSVSLEDAFAGYTPEDEDVIKGANSFAQFYDLGDGFTFWDGGLTTLHPGQGYMYKSNSNNTKTLTFQNGSRGMMVEDASLEGETFLAMGNDFANNMTITAIIELDGENLRSDNYELAAFVGNDCRGSIKMKYVKPLDQYLAFLLVHGDQEESLRFVLTDGQECSWSKDNLLYTNDATYGTPTQPVVLHFGPMGVNENNIVVVSIYPNPSHDVFNIEGEDIQKVDVINAFGQVIYSNEINNNSLQIDLSRHSIGAYLVRVVTSKGVTTQQIIKE